MTSDIIFLTRTSLRMSQQEINRSLFDEQMVVQMVKDKILARLEEIRSRFDDPKIQRRFKEYNKTLLFVFPDIDASIYLKIGDAKIDEIGEGTPDAELQVTMDSSIFFAIFDKTESPMAAYSSGKLKTKGEVPDLLKLQKLLM